jgi:DNA polymerase III sliding clamp (beta) subunit (PCNA family)
MPAKGEAARVEVIDPEHKTRDYTAPNKEAREALSIRILAADNERLRVAAFTENRTKQSLLDQAIGEFLDRAGY